MIAARRELSYTHLFFFPSTYMASASFLSVPGWTICVCVCVCVCVSHSVMSDSAASWILARQALSMEFSRQEYWSGLPLPFPRGLADPGIEPRLLTLQADSLLPELPGKLMDHPCSCLKLSPPILS